MKRKHMAVVVVLAFGCVAEEGPFAFVPGSELESLADAALGRSSSDPPFTDIVDVETLGTDTVVVLDAAPPFVHIYLADGTYLDATGREGDGPGELKTPWDIVANAGRLWILDRSRAIEWDRELHEVRRVPVPAQTALLSRGCGRELVAVLEGGSEGGEERSYTLALWDGAEWTELSQPQPPKLPFVIGWPRFSAAGTNEGLAIIHWWERRVEILSCSGAPPRFITIMAETEMEMDPAPEGIAAAGSTMFAFYADRRLRIDTTYVAAVPPDRSEGIRRLGLEGRYALHTITDSHVWLSSHSLEPYVFSVPIQEFVAWFESRSRLWTEQ
jgi:hypothetical protein